MPRIDWGIRIDLPDRLFRSAIHDLDIAGITEQPVAFPRGQFLHNTETFQMTERLVDRGWSDAGLLHQPP